ncbi:verprolin-like [Nilaparvata lugens]|uniref:verprolin-like n=1 Tax=Nilaparvata lugens TaxID=108931 RepID=UPI00193D9C31|nr:verprolin-like [Nilaparvata lugens]
MMMQQLLNPPMPMSYNIMWPPNYYGMPLHPIVGNPLVNSLASQYNQPNYFPNSAANTFVTNSLYQQNPLLNVGLPTTPANVPMNAGPVPPPPPAPSPPATVTAGSCHADSSSGETVLAPPSPSPIEQESVAVESPVNQLSDALQDSDANTETTAEVEILEETRLVSKDRGNDWETFDSANEANRESADSDVDTDAGGQAARRPTFNPLTQRTSKPMSRSARKRLRKSMLKNKDKGSAAATLPVIADNSESNLTTTDFISSSASTTTMDSSNEAETLCPLQTQERTMKPKINPRVIKPIRKA